MNVIKVADLDQPWPYGEDEETQAYQRAEDQEIEDFQADQESDA